MRETADEAHVGRITRSLARLQKPLRSHAAAHGRRAALAGMAEAFRYNAFGAVLQELCVELLDVEHFDEPGVRWRLRAAFAAGARS